MNGFTSSTLTNIEVEEQPIRPITKRVVCYAIVDPEEVEKPVGIGLSVIDAWRSARQCLGETDEQLRKDGYILVEGIYQTWHWPIKP